MLHNSVRRRYRRLLLAVGGTLLYAAGINLFISPLGLFSGGLLGVAQLTHTLLRRTVGYAGFDFSGLLYYALNVPLFLLSARTLGRGFLRRSLLCTTTSAIFLSLLPSPAAPLLEDVPACCLLGGAVAGFGAGTVLTCGACCGGLDLLGLYLSRRGARLTVGRLSTLFNSVLFALCALLVNVSAMLYSALYAVFFALVLDRTHQQSVNVQVLLFTKGQAEPISAFILDQLHRGVTRWTGQGGFTGEEVQILCACMSKYEVGELRDALHRLDPHAFYTVQEGIRLSDNFIRRLTE